MAHVIVAYVPVLHEGYMKFFKNYGGGELLVLDRSITSEFPRLERDIRALEPHTVVRVVNSLYIFESARLFTSTSTLGNSREVIMPEEDLSHFVADKYFARHRVKFESVFLRWEGMASLSKRPVSPDQKISDSEFDRAVMRIAYGEACRSSDWWRRVGGVVVRDGKILYSAHNAHFPTEYSPYIDGDPRINFDAGKNIECSTAIHAEEAIISEAASDGVSLRGASLYVTTFPCVKCARMIERVGFSEVYYTEGYSNLGGEEIIRSRGIKLIHVSDEPPPK